MFNPPLFLFLVVDVDLKIPLTEELIKVTIVHKLRLYTEYHLIVLKTNEEKRKEEEGEGKPMDQSEMNVLLITYDSQSRANIQRQWTNSYKWFEKDPNSVIMKVSSFPIFTERKRILI